jgi:hypothetical protein
VNALHRADLYGVQHVIDAICPLVNHSRSSEPLFDPERIRRRRGALDAPDAVRFVHENALVRDVSGSVVAEFVY